MSYYEILYGYLGRNELPWVSDVSCEDYLRFCELVDAQVSQSDARPCPGRAPLKREVFQLVIAFPVV